MKRWEILLLHLSFALVAGTGLVYGWMRYLFEPPDAFSVVNHPYQPLLQHLHVLAAPLLVFAAGLVWRSHVIAKWRNGRTARRSGQALALTLVPAVASGYLLQVSVAETWHTVWVVLHVATGLLWASANLAHMLSALRERRNGHGRPGTSPLRRSRS